MARQHRDQSTGDPGSGTGVGACVLADSAPFSLAPLRGVLLSGVSDRVTRLLTLYLRQMSFESYKTRERFSFRGALVRRPRAARAAGDPSLRRRRDEGGAGGGGGGGGGGMRAWCKVLRTHAVSLFWTCGRLAGCQHRGHCTQLGTTEYYCVRHRTVWRGYRRSI